MNLKTRSGELDLPSDFTLTMERTNPLLSDEGDASVPTTLPSSSKNLTALGHRERIDRAARYTNKVEAILQVGPVQKRGQLVIDSVHSRDGIDASFAIDSSDLYVKAKVKSLKTIFEEKNQDGVSKETFNDIDAACEKMESVYQNGYPDGDYVIFPVAIAPYEVGDGDEKHTVYQYNNEDDGSNGLVCDERIVHEGDINMCVQKGYGLAPFLKLQRLLQRLFECLGYTVVSNCFDDAPYYSQIVIVHNCADCLCNPDTTLYYADLVPSCTLSEFLDWLLAKFHVQPVVDSEAKRVRIVKMDAMLNTLTGPGGYDLDISGMVEGDWTVQLNPSKRVVLTPNNEIEGTEPAAETFDKLLEKYGDYADCNEDQFDSLTGQTPAFYDCLVRRRATGEFYLLERSLGSGEMQLHRTGTNYFTYDRNNSDDTEAFSQTDVMPLMLIGEKREVVPFIGKRIHRHTSYDDKTDDSEQKIIAVQAHTGQYFVYPTSGTTQKDIPYASGSLMYSFWFGLDNYSLYNNFWSNYNRLLLNNPVHLTGRVKYSIDQFLGMNMSTLKLCDGQRLLPVKASAQIGDRMGMTEAEFILAKIYAGGVADSPFAPVTESSLKWQMTSDSDETTARLLFLQNIYIEGQVLWRGYSAEHDGLSDPMWLGTPSYLGEPRVITAVVDFIIKTTEKVTVGGIEMWYDREWRNDGHYDEEGNLLPGNTPPDGWLRVTKTYTFEAVAVE